MGQQAEIRGTTQQGSPGSLLLPQMVQQGKQKAAVGIDAGVDSQHSQVLPCAVIVEATRLQCRTPLAGLPGALPGQGRTTTQMRLQMPMQFASLMRQCVDSAKQVRRIQIGR